MVDCRLIECTTQYPVLLALTIPKWWFITSTLHDIDQYPRVYSHRTSTNKSKNLIGGKWIVDENWLFAKTATVFAAESVSLYGNEVNTHTHTRTSRAPDVSLRRRKIHKWFALCIICFHIQPNSTTTCLNVMKWKFISYWDWDWHRGHRSQTIPDPTSSELAQTPELYLVPWNSFPWYPSCPILRLCSISCPFAWYSRA